MSARQRELLEAARAAVQSLRDGDHDHALALRLAEAIDGAERDVTTEAWQAGASPWSEFGRPCYRRVAAMLRAAARALDDAEALDRSAHYGPTMSARRRHEIAREAAGARFDEAARVADAAAALRVLLESADDVGRERIAAGVPGLTAPTELGAVLPDARRQIGGAA